MSLFKQISILLSIVFTILFILIASISFNEIKDSAQKSLYQNVQNSVSNISLSITNAQADISTIKTVLNASFDNGNYEKIIFKDLDNNIVHQRGKKEESLEKKFPLWFLNFVNIDEVSASSTISQGWTVLGTLEVFADRDIFYNQIYAIFINLIITLVITFIVFLFVLSLLFKSILKPLSIIKEQSDSIMQNKFIFQKKIPFTLEFKSVTISINSMVEKIQNMFNHANEILKKNKELLYVDELTKLYNRRYLILKTSEYLEENSINHLGYIISIVLTRIDLLNKKVGYKKADKLFIEMANIMKELTLVNESNIISRTNAAEFIIILPRTKENDAKNIAKQLSISLNKILKNIKDEDIKLYMGLCTFEGERNHSDLLSKIDYTLSQSKILQDKDYFYMKNDDVYETRDNWRELINTALKENDYFNILYRDVLDIDSKEIVYKTISFEIKTKNKTYSYGEFIASVIELNLLEEVYLNIISKVLNIHRYNKKISIQIPSNFIENISFEKLRNIFDKNNSFKNIIFELEEDSFVKYYYNSLAFINIIEEYGFDIAIFNFMGISDDYNYLKSKKIEYIKVNQKFLETVENLDALNMVKMSLGIKLIATSINTKEELNALKNKDIKLIAGKITEGILYK
ncbi:diguanylate cyclase [Halarcobacter mediterraneus]|uniref:Diguanylate cyclase n=1 Tax=Halarcobacter mediterraneus TaxID=2023153 RepID=A0A4Q1AQS9_9BACT|nr:LapD/MoxY N-terminal periplasmic domain-containing protein [Halarcobacter mediterraneus]RXK11792.1 diguanylate cyclase [Halarcobacter mediterraneus]